ncbi:uncharacterized protein PHALS_15337 [Plasmopara halstedii]|uniref:Uncharacterized protein n=1 Tax=Plasmopara halstedii TaxID=4781 RepID=A0A0P1AEE3_PLAHL|nr:uncharacterized protein PHALS_15337 [Plasmopara halstedii]CEG38818.1 hypothetical protein PHALS_15337 [Plasmopara halstedii]|eukprot:XP_024575187.1 hypothetical protein PHALS_15337 [Plasmopara halstedii]
MKNGKRLNHTSHRKHQSWKEKAINIISVILCPTNNTWEVILNHYAVVVSRKRIAIPCKTTNFLWQSRDRDQNFLEAALLAGPVCESWVNIIVNQQVSES